MPSRDIETLDDIIKIVDYQYKQLLSDSITSSKFSHLEVKAHMPIIYGFWGFLILGSPHEYKGSAYEKHVPLNLEKIHFDKWLQFLSEGIDIYCTGPKAQMMKERAQHLGLVFKAKMNLPLD
jgi:hemoglobin